jgi:hypothetical protein
MFKNKYRIVTEIDKEIDEEITFYVVQVRYWFLPFWTEYGINGYVRYESALELLNRLKQK